MIKVQGTSRVIVENVQPFIDNGLYPAKRTVGEQVEVTADILGDGHDHIRARVLFKKSTESKWHQTEMVHLWNDFWKGTFDTTEKGVYVFKVMAWIDHFDTWYDGFRKKVAANVDVHLELREGVVFLKTLETRGHRLTHAIARLEGMIIRLLIMQQRPTTNMKSSSNISALTLLPGTNCFPDLHHLKTGTAHFAM
jgi:starch synthase (maltosyl-transferring)